MNLTIRQILLSLILFLLIENCFSQATYRRFSEETDVVKKAEIARFLWNEYLRNDLDSLKLITVKLLESAKENKNAFAKAIGNSSLGSYLIRTGDINGGLLHLKEAENFFDQRSDFVLLSETRNEIGHANYLAGEYTDAIKAYLASIKAGKKAKSDPTAAFNGFLGLGRSYIGKGDTAVGVYTLHEYKERSLNHSKYEAAADAYSYLGMIEMDRGNVNLSREYYEKSIKYSERSSSKIHISHAYNNKAILHFSLGELDSSLLYFEQALRLRERINNIKGIIESYYNIGYYYEETGDYHNAYMYYTKSMEIARDRHFSSDELDALLELIDICEALNYSSELENYASKRDSIKKLLVKKNADDQEVIAYSKKILKEMKIEEDPKIKESRSNFYVWLIPGFVLMLGVAMFRRRA